MSVLACREVQSFEEKLLVFTLEANSDCSISLADYFPDSKTLQCEKMNLYVHFPTKAAVSSSFLVVFVIVQYRCPHVYRRTLLGLNL
jgi:hypothetical protein